METQSPGSSAAACSPPKGANCPRCLYLAITKKIKLERKRKEIGTVNFEKSYPLLRAWDKRLLPKFPAGLKEIAPYSLPPNQIIEEVT